MKLRCPVCHSSNSLEAFVADDTGRELLVLLAKSGPLFRPLVSYLGCFRPASRDLAHERALKLAREVLEIGADPHALAAALAETVEAMRAKRDAGDVRPLKNHNYLKRVMESVGAGLVPALGRPQGAPLPPAREGRPRVEHALAEWAGTDWLRLEIAHGLAALAVMGLGKTPGADTITRTADIWHHVLVKHRCLVAEVDARRVKTAFSSLLAQVEKWWPEPAAMISHLPRRPEREKLAAPVSEEDRGRGVESIRKIMEGL